MTIEEAIERLEGRRMTMSMIGSVEECKKENEAIEMAVSALLAQSEKFDHVHAAGGCYCSECEYFLPNIFGCGRNLQRVNREGREDFCSLGQRKEELKND